MIYESCVGNIMSGLILHGLILSISQKALDRFLYVLGIKILHRVCYDETDIIMPRLESLTPDDCHF